MVVVVAWVGAGVHGIVVVVGALVVVRVVNIVVGLAVVVHICVDADVDIIITS